MTTVILKDLRIDATASTRFGSSASFRVVSAPTRATSLALGSASRSLQAIQLPVQFVRVRKAQCGHHRALGRSRKFDHVTADEVLYMNQRMCIPRIGTPHSMRPTVSSHPFRTQYLLRKRRKTSWQDLMREKRCVWRSSLSSLIQKP